MSIWACESLSSLYTFIIIVIVAVHFSHLTAVSSKLFLSKCVIFAFGASNSPLHPAAVRRGKEKQERENGMWFGESWWEH